MRADAVVDEPIVLVVEQVVDSLDLSDLYSRYSDQGRSFYNPSMMLKVLFYSYSEGVRSSREIAKRIRYDIRYRYYTGKLMLDFRTINRFRLENFDLAEPLSVPSGENPGRIQNINDSNIARHQMTDNTPTYGTASGRRPPSNVHIELRWHA